MTLCCKLLVLRAANPLGAEGRDARSASSPLASTVGGFDADQHLKGNDAAQAEADLQLRPEHEAG